MEYLAGLAILALVAYAYMRIGYRPDADDPMPTDPHAAYPTRSVAEALEPYSSPHLKALVDDHDARAAQDAISSRSLAAAIRSLK